MDLKVKRNDTGEIVNVRKYIKSENPEEQHIWSNEWYGHHIIGLDCEWCEGNPVADTESKLNLAGVVGQSEQFTCKTCGTHEKVWSRKNDDWYCKTCGHICR